MIAGAEPTCLVAGRYARVDACIGPAERIGRAQVRFRADDAGPWYAVDMTPGEGCLHATLPRPLARTRTVAYFVDVIDRESKEAFRPELAPEEPFHARVVTRARECHDLGLQAAPASQVPPPRLVSVALDASGRPLTGAARQALAAATAPPGFSADGLVRAPTTGPSGVSAPPAAGAGRQETAVLAATVAGVAVTLGAVKWAAGSHKSPDLSGEWMGPANASISSGAVPLETCTAVRTLDANQIGEYVSGTITLGAPACSAVGSGARGGPASSAAVVSFAGTSDAGYIQFTFNQDTGCSPTEFTGLLVGTTLSGTFRRTCPSLTEVTDWTARRVAGRTSVGPSSTSETR